MLQRECPPQCPPRPASYTPSSNNEQVLLGSCASAAAAAAAAVALNNLDTLRSYGSAGDELENFPPDYLRNLNRSMASHQVVPSIVVGSGGPGNNALTDLPPLDKPSWQEQMQLASFITDATKIKNGEFGRLSLRNPRSLYRTPGFLPPPKALLCAVAVFFL